MKVSVKKTIDRDVLIAALTELHTRKEDLDEQFDELESLFGSVCDGTLYDSVFKMFDRYCEFLCMALGLNIDDLCWFIFDLEFGEAGDNITVNGKTFMVDSIEAFVDYSIASQKS